MDNNTYTIDLTATNERGFAPVRRRRSQMEEAVVADFLPTESGGFVFFKDQLRPYSAEDLRQLADTLERVNESVPPERVKSVAVN
jgi:hypothetical protein